MSRTCLAGAAAMLASLALAAPAGLAIAQTPAGPRGDLAGMTTTIKAPRPDPSGGAMAYTDRTTILSVSAGVLTLEHAALLVHANGAVLRRVVSDVTVPLDDVTLTRTGGGMRITCDDNSACIHWAHSDFYDEAGANVGDSGDTTTYGLAMEGEGQSRFFAALCPMTHCA